MNDTIPVNAALRHAMASADWAALRHVSETTTLRSVRNGQPERNQSEVDSGAMCEVLVDGHLAYAATADLSPGGLRRAFDRAIAAARATTHYKLQHADTSLRPPAHGRFRSQRGIDLDRASLAQITDTLVAATGAMALSERLVDRRASAMLVQTRSSYHSTSGTDIDQQSDIVDLTLAATAAHGVQSQTRSWSRTGQIGAEAFDHGTLLAHGERVAREAMLLLAADNCPSETLDLILMPDQMMLQIHESIGHPLELDRILGDERNYAGWSFVRPQDFGQLQYGSNLMNVAFDPGMDHELASYGFDDTGNPATRQLLIEAGVLRRGLGSLESQARSGLPGVANSRAASWNRAPIDRMANINLEPGSSTLLQLIGQVEHGMLMATNRSWSIDDYRNKFQFGCEFGQLVQDGRLGKLVRNPNYRGVTVDFWNRLAGVGQEQEIHGTAYCGKGEPNQVIRVGHAAPPCLFRAIDVFGGQS